MSSSIYDPTGDVAAAGGIPEYIAANAGKEEVFLTIITTNTDGTYSADHTYAEIKAASAANKCCLCKHGHILMSLRGQFSYSSVGNYYQFVSTPFIGTGYIVIFNVMESGSVQFVERFVPLHDNQSKRGTVTGFTATSDAITDLICTVDWELDGRIVAAQIKLSCRNTSNELSSIRLDGQSISMPGSIDTKIWFMANEVEGTNPEYIVNFFSRSQSDSSMRPSLLIARRDGGTIGSNISFRVQFAYYAAPYST